MAIMWNRKLVEILIFLYKGHPVLYEKHKNGYHYRKQRETAINAIVDDLSKIQPVTADDVKKKIKTLRSQYSSEKSYHYSCLKSGFIEESGPKLWCYPLLTFLDQHIKVRSVKGVGENTLIQDKDKCESSIQSLESDSYVTEISEIQPNGYLVPTKTPGESLLKDLKERDGNVPNCIMKLTRESSNVIAKPADTNDVFGKYVASELNAITDKRILSEAKVAIEGILNDARIMILKENTLL